MDAPPNLRPTDKYSKDYAEAYAHYEADDLEKAVEVAKYNLTDPTLPRYWQVKNCILIVCASTDWDEAEVST